MAAEVYCLFRVYDDSECQFMNYELLSIHSTLDGAMKKAQELKGPIRICSRSPEETDKGFIHRANDLVIERVQVET